ncbi:hypothetical protein F3Y22_tig00110474pilonHSYRG00178 [Hibiscus syriacus]|uniref:Polyadenylate-binding protein n=1 Tax=Hibiscus syriacus TaxID=106335 RepID=A0A6A3AEZ6_HIBSY|nr:hypothetical protein F3Y22_tig00110474pilonHSYRG00178 [Hibiscus syriacus]
MAQVQVQARNGSINNGTGAGNNQQYMTTISLYVGDLDYSVTETQLYFSQMGPILTVRVCRVMSTRMSLGYGHVNYCNPQDAARALELLNFTPSNGISGLCIPTAIPISNLDKGIDHRALLNTFSTFGNILSCKIATDSSVQSKESLGSISDEDLKKFFGEFGTITSVVVMWGSDGKCKGFGFINFEIADDAARAVESLNGKKFDDEECITDEKLEELFSLYGIITSCKVMRDPSGISKGSGFVAFSTPEEASRAVGSIFSNAITCNGTFSCTTYANVLTSSSKSRTANILRSRTSDHFSSTEISDLACGCFFCQPGFGYQQQLDPGMRPGGAPMPNFYMLPRGRVYRYPPGRSDGSVPTGGMLSVPYDIGGMPMRDASLSQPIPIGALASALANATLEQQRTMLGENLYLVVEQVEPETAAKVTGMLLEMDQTEVLHLLESPEALKAKVVEAMDVLRTVAQMQQSGGAADQLASLS